MKPLSLWAKHRWWVDGLRAPPLAPLRPADSQQHAEQRWDNEGGTPPMGDPPDENPHQHLQDGTNLQLAAASPRCPAARWKGQV